MEMLLMGIVSGFGFRPQQIQLLSAAIQLAESCRKRTVAVGYYRMQPPATAATITVHLFLCAASCLSVSQLSAKPLRTEGEHIHHVC